MDPRDPAAIFSRETQIRRDRFGRWWNADVPITHPNLVEAFNRWLERDDEGRFLLRNDINWAYVAIEGPALFVRRIELGGGGPIVLFLSDGRREPLDPRTLREAEDGALYCDVRGGRMTARFEREAMSQLAAMLGEDGDGVFLELDGRRYRPPIVADPLSPRVTV